MAHVGLHQPVVHYDCAENQIRSLVGRVAGVVPKPTKDGLSALRAAAKILREKLPHTSANPLYDMPARYSGNKRKRYEQACDEYTMTGLSKRDATIKMFVKPERFDPCAKTNPDPRAIQFRNAKYCVALAQFLHPIEHHIYNIDTANHGVPPSRSVAKGLNSVQRAALLVEKAKHFRNPVFVGLDASRFDKHVDAELLKIEHSVYLYSNPDPLFARILSLQIVNKCFSNLGLVYKVLGRRMSGDMNTAVGNCLLMLIFLRAFFSIVPVERWDCIDDGDDVVVIVEEDDFEIVEPQVLPVFLSFGMEMKVECVVRDIHEVVFCRSNMVEFAPDRFKFVRNYLGVMSGALCGVRHWQCETYRLRVLQAIGTCELVLNLGVPILQSFALAILRNCKTSKPLDLSLAPDGLQRRTFRDLKALGVAPDKIEPWPVPTCSRLSFAVAFGLEPNDQIRLERKLDNWVFATRGLEVWPSEIIESTWEYCPQTGEVYGLQG